MKKSLLILLALVISFSMLAGCAGGSGGVNNTDKDGFSLATLTGPTTMGLVKLLDQSKKGELDYNVRNTIYGTADEISALIISGKVDMAAVPCNAASVLYNKTEGGVSVIAVNTLGVLNVLELGESINSVSDLAGKTIYSTGMGTTPDYAFNAIMRANGFEPGADYTIEYKSESTEIAALLAGDSAAEGTVAILPQPYASTVLARNPNARIALDLTQEWKSAGIEGNLITGVFIVRSEFLRENGGLVDSFLADYAKSAEWVNSNIPEAAVMVAELGIVADAAIAETALPHCAITSVAGAEMKRDISAYLEVLFKADAAYIGGAMPGDDFYYNA